MPNWYIKAKLKDKLKPTSKVRAVDFTKFHRLYAMGVKDENLLNKMVADLEPVILYVTRNSSLRDAPGVWSPPCPSCGTDADEVGQGLGDMTFFNVDQELDEEHQELARQYNLDHEILKGKYREGYWLCEHCGRTTGWWEFMDTTKDENGKWMYTDASHSIWDWFIRAQRGKDFNERLVAFEKIMEFVHGSGPQSNWFIEGGTDTIDRVKRFLEQSGLHSQLHKSYL